MMIKIRNLKKAYNSGVEQPILDGIYTDIHEKEFIAIMGPSGCGKSTLFKILGLLDHPDTGEYYFMGQETSKLAAGERNSLRKGSIGLLSHNYHLIDELTVFENIELPLLYKKKEPPAIRKTKVKEVMEMMNILHRRNDFPHQLSKIQQLRVELARAIVTSPQLILADEPTRDLDSVNAEEMMRLLTQLNDKGITIVMMTCSISDANYTHRIIYLVDGKIITENFIEQFHI